MNLIIDINNAFYKSYFIYREMYKGQEKINEKLLMNKFMVDLMYSIRIFAKETKIDKVICCYDGANNFRKKLSAKYKASRLKKDQEFYNVLEYSRTYLKNLGFIVSNLEGLEADDCIGIWARHLQNEDNCILSNDEDVRQLLSDKTCIYNNQSKTKVFYSSHSENGLAYNILAKIKGKYEIVNPHFILFEKILRGCKGDEIDSLLKGRVYNKKLIEVFEKVKFDKDAITTEMLDNIVDQVHIQFIDQDITMFKLFNNLSLVDLGGSFIPNKSMVLDHINENKDAFKYNGIYEYEYS